ncbi:uncharacterized protein J4E78_002033 [Alternaria triticimaculans]|uniref:uncharacterized protein n=1 Tax=Alternaria triticimaculans TaxID=297637 RepID=UPI0020C4338C|nr:uncharacterized protein J4E78_002033 [Alternaria triticimaculans]KAI4668209.1 hypothetical protein J4E78_002033 [Alternaria triticimaculans]
MPTIPTALQARSTAPMNPASVMAPSPSKKRKAEEANPISKSGSDMAQRSDPSLTAPTRDHLLPNGHTDDQKTPAKRLKTTHAKRNVAPGPAASTTSRTIASSRVSATGAVHVVMNDTPTQSSMTPSTELRAAKTKVHNSAVSGTEDVYIMETEDDTASEEEPSASEEESYASEEEEDGVEEEDDDAVVSEQLRAKATGKSPSHLCHGRFQLTNIVFNPLPRPAITPWDYGFPAPTPPYHDQSSCPVDWSKVVIDSKVSKRCEKAYELRRPWQQEPVAWDKMAELGNVSAEGVRKRFASANKAVFELTGVYFATSPLGLAEYDIPLYAELKNFLPDTSEASPVLSKEPITNPLFYDGEAVQLVIFPPGQDGGVNRFVPQEVMDRLPINDQHFLEYSLDNFDRWYTSAFLGRRHTFPRRIYRLEPYDDTSFIHRDNGTPSIAMSDLFETYRLSQAMGTTEVCDMILDEIVLSFKQEIELVKEHEEGKVTMQDCDNTIQFMSFRIDDVNLLWEHTKANDKIRMVVLESLFDQVELLRAKVEKQKRHLNRDFVIDWCFHTILLMMAGPCDIVQRFRRGEGNLQDFCARYHDHGNSKSECFRAKPESSKLIPEETDEPRIIKVRFGTVDLEIEDRASYAGVIFRFERLVEDKSEWDWLRIRSIATFVEGPLVPDARRRKWHLEPIYYELDTIDAHGRYPCHPGYQNQDWTHPVGEPDVYDEPWGKVIRREVPAGATKYRETKIPAGKDEHGKIIFKVTEVFFEIEDPRWYPPNDWNADMDPCDFWPQELREYRRWLWVEEGGTIPRIEVQRFRPYEDDTRHWKEPFVDRMNKLSVFDILN